MKQDQSYIAITIGPIGSTMQLTTSPAALWASSYMFSYIAGKLKAFLIQNGVSEEAFITPYVLPDHKDILEQHDGVGLLHDHIIFEKPEGFSMEQMKLIRENVLADAALAFGLAGYEDYLRHYIMISAVAYTAENPILGSSKMLDCMELASAFVPEERKNPILAFFTSKDPSSTESGSGNQSKESDRNKAIKNQAINTLGIDQHRWQLLDKNGRIRDLKHIASGGRTNEEKAGMKKFEYYAVVRSDGDNMGKLIGSLQNKKQFRLFSDACLRYCSRVSARVKAYGGMTVYAGGDDLLALMPCQGNEDKALLDFVCETNRLFDEIFLGKSDEAERSGAIRLIEDAADDEIGKEAIRNLIKDTPPSLTWGMTLCHYKYPLYEALEDSASLLFGAKGNDFKNAVSLRLIKHSGQTSTVCIPNGLLKNPQEQDGGETAPEQGTILHVQRSLSGIAAADDMLLSALHKVHTFGSFFCQADSERAKHMFKNMFDAVSHEGNTFLHEALPKLYDLAFLQGGTSALDEQGKKVIINQTQKPDPAAALSSFLRIMRFYVEKAGDRD